MLPPLGAHTPASRICRLRSAGPGALFSRRIERVVRIISNRSVVADAVSTMLFSLLRYPRYRQDSSVQGRRSTVHKKVGSASVGADGAFSGVLDAGSIFARIAFHCSMRDDLSTGFHAIARLNNSARATFSSSLSRKRRPRLS